MTENIQSNGSGPQVQNSPENRAPLAAQNTIENVPNLAQPALPDSGESQAGNKNLGQLSPAQQVTGNGQMKMTVEPTSGEATRGEQSGASKPTVVCPLPANSRAAQPSERLGEKPAPSAAAASSLGDDVKIEMAITVTTRHGVLVDTKQPVILPMALNPELLGTSIQQFDTMIKSLLVTPAVTRFAALIHSKMEALAAEKENAVATKAGNGLFGQGRPPAPIRLTVPEPAPNPARMIVPSQSNTMSLPNDW